MKVAAFFYGSYMDADVLRRFGANPAAPKAAHVRGWKLSFTPHANMVQGTPEDVVHGFVYGLSHGDLDKLYGPEGYVTTYKPVPVMAIVGSAAVPTRTFVELAAQQAPEGAYLEAFVAICVRLGLPSEYVACIRAHAASLVRGTLA